MKKESIEMFSVPFMITTKRGFIYTVKKIKKLDDSSIAFYDKFDGLNTLDLIDVSGLNQINKKEVNQDARPRE